MITKQELDAANREAEQAHDNAERFRTPVRFTQEQWNQALENVIKLQADLAASQKREAAMRTALVDLVEDFETWLIDHDVDPKTQSRLKTSHEALSTPAPQGWVKLRWRPGTENPNPVGKLILIDIGKSYIIARHDFEYIQPCERWTYADELLGGGQ